MVHIEALRQNGTERIAHQHVIDRAIKRDKDLRQAAKQNQWWMNLTTASEIEESDDEHELFVDEAVVISDEQQVGNTTDFLRTFIETDEYKKLDTMLLGYLESPMTRDDRDKTLREFSGAAYERLAHLYFAESYEDLGTVYSPEQTDQYFLKHFGEGRVIEHPFGKIGIAGIIVPDSLVLDGEDVVFQAEFSLHGKEDYYHHKYAGFLKSKYDNRFGNAYDNTRLVFGVPESFSSAMQQDLQSTYGEDVAFFHLPFTHHDFYRNVLNPVSYLWQQ